MQNFMHSSVTGATKTWWGAKLQFKSTSIRGVNLCSAPILVSIWKQSANLFKITIQTDTTYFLFLPTNDSPNSYTFLVKSFQFQTSIAADLMIWVYKVDEFFIYCDIPSTLHD